MLRLKSMKALKTLLLVPLFCLSSCNLIVSSDSEKYSDYRESLIKNTDCHSELYIFPENVDTSKINNLVYMSEESLFTGSYFLYASIDFTEEEYVTEIDRLKEIYAEFKNGERKPIISDKDNHIFITIARDMRFEFAMYNEEKHRIYYVTNQLFSWSAVTIDFEVPEFNIPSEVDDGDNSYNMYYYYTKDIGYYVND